MAEKKEKGSPRRSFLKLGLGLGAATMAGAMTGKLLGANEKPSSGSGEKVKVLTTDGKLIEIDAEAVGLARKKRYIYPERQPGKGFPTGNL